MLKPAKVSTCGSAANPTIAGEKGATAVPT